MEASGSSCADSGLTNCSESLSSLAPTGCGGLSSIAEGAASYCARPVTGELPCRLGAREVLTDCRRGGSNDEDDIAAMSGIPFQRNGSGMSLKSPISSRMDRQPQRKCVACALPLLRRHVKDGDSSVGFQLQPSDWPVCQIDNAREKCGRTLQI